MIRAMAAGSIVAEPRFLELDRDRAGAEGMC